MTPYEIFEDLRYKVIWLKIQPGTTLNLVELASTYKVSRNPITIALTKLESEEWVVKNGSHFVVSPLTLERMREITEIRHILEVQAYIWSMNRISAESLKELHLLKEEIIALNSNVSKQSIIELDVRFHQIIYQGTQNRQLANTLDRLLNHYLRFWLSSPTPIDPTSFFKDIVDIIDAFDAKDELQLKTACTSHIKASLDEIMGISHI